MVAAAAAAAEQKPVTEWIEIIAPEESGGAPSPTAQRPGPSHRKRISQPRLPKDCALRVRVRLRHSRVARLEELVTSLASTNSSAHGRSFGSLLLLT